MRTISHIVIHTAAAAHDGRPVDQSAETIRAYHKSKGWSDIGYHFVVRFNGTVEFGRPIGRPGAHVEGFNQKTIGICFAGHGDLAPFTPDQYEGGVKLVADLLAEFNLVDEFRANPFRVLGHREVNQIPGVPHTNKSCPGRKVDCADFRRRVIAEVKRRGWTSDAQVDGDKEYRDSDEEA